jgi:hypothetical protein
MSWGGPGFVIAIVMLSMSAWVFTTWIRAKHGYPLEDQWTGNAIERTNPDADRKISLLANENEQLTGKIGRLEERIGVLERIATDANSSSSRLADEIDRLRVEKDRA